MMAVGDVAHVVNCTITSNTSTATNEQASAAPTFLNGGGDNIVVNSIVWGNSNGDGSDEGAQIAEANVIVFNSDVQGLDTFAGSGNFDIDPLFVDDSNDDYSIEYLSELLNSGDEGEVPADTYDIDDDSDTAELLPDRAVNDRQNNPTDCVDVGAFENQVAGTCTADITDDSTGEPDGDVGDPDLDLVYERWGSVGGVADIAPAPCGNGVVDVDDLLAVINNWGSCNSFGPTGLTTGQAVEMLCLRLLTHPEQEDAIMESIDYLVEHGV